MNNLNTILSLLSNFKARTNTSQAVNTSTNLYPSSNFDVNNSTNQSSNINQDMLMKLLTGDKDNLASTLATSNPMLSKLMPLLQQKKTARNTVNKKTKITHRDSIDFSNLTKVDDYHLSIKE